jgi:glycosyltransferase involved in cell wall biosynthesis
LTSIIIPYIDEHNYLAQAIASAVAQHGVDMEIIVVCNAVTIPSEYNPIPSGLKNVKFIHQPIPGSAHARNAGLKAAQGEWIQFLDVDDLLEPEKINHQLQNAVADVIVSPHIYLELNGKRERSKWIPEDVWRGLLDSGLGSTSSMLWLRQALLDVGGWNTTLQSHQEYELLFRLACSGKKIMMDEHWETIVRQRKSGSITSTSRPVRVKEGIQLRMQMWNYLLVQKLDTPERFDAFRQYLFRQLRGLFRQDKKEAMELYIQYFSDSSFTPKAIHVPGYNVMYQLMGFYRTETILQFLVSFGKTK